jgi:diaminopimelate epimerase
VLRANIVVLKQILRTNTEEMLNHSFRKYAGAGNDFIVLNAFERGLGLSETEEQAFVRAACSRKGTGLGSDGLILLTPSELAPFGMRFYNPDGSYGALCGNGSRCAVQAAEDLGIVTGSETDFEVLGKVNHAEILGDQSIRVHFQNPTKMKFNFKIRVGKKDFITASYVDVGSQHAIVFFEDLRALENGTLEDFDIMRWGSTLRWHPDFAPVGVNANFTELRSDADGPYLRIRTFERGVEGETLACGTGCMSTAITAYATGQLRELPIRLLTQSGEFVKVGFRPDGDQVRDLWLEGSAVRGLEGELKFDPKSNDFSYFAK